MQCKVSSRVQRIHSQLKSIKVTLHSHHTPSPLLSNKVRSMPWPDNIWDMSDQSSFFNGYNRVTKATDTHSEHVIIYCFCTVTTVNPLTPNNDYSGRTAPLTSKCCILYISSTNIGTEYFKHGIYSPFFPLQNAVCFINLTYLVPVLFTFYVQDVLKLKKIIPAPKG